MGQVVYLPGNGTEVLEDRGLALSMYKMNDRAVILIEDNADDRELTVRALGRCRPNLRLICMEDGAEAADYFSNLNKPATSTSAGRFKIGLIILDLKMPKVDGFEFLRKLRSQASTKNIPVVVLTSSNERRDITAAYQCGANSYLTKPVEFDRFVELIQCVCRYWLDFNETLS